MFQNGFPPKESRPACPLVRVPPTGQLRCVALGGELVEIPVHYYDGRSLGCIGSDCPLCQIHNLPRWKLYLSVHLPTKPGRAILEIPITAGTDIRRRFDAGTLRGSLLTASRCGSSGRGRVVVTVHPEPMNVPRAATPADVADVLLTVWRYPSRREFPDPNDLYRACFLHLQELTARQTTTN